jgi:hypothetical protein
MKRPTMGYRMTLPARRYEAWLLASSSDNPYRCSITFLLQWFSGIYVSNRTSDLRGKMSERRPYRAAENIKANVSRDRIYLDNPFA